MGGAFHPTQSPSRGTLQSVSGDPDEGGHGVLTSGYSEITMADSSDTETSSSASSGDLEHLQEDKGLVPYDFEPYESDDAIEDTAAVESLRLKGESSDVLSTGNARKGAPVTSLIFRRLISSRRPLP